MDGRLAEHFSGVGVKRLSRVDCIGERQVGRGSNQHELGVTKPMLAFLGDPGSDKVYFRCSYFRFDDELAGGAFSSEQSTITFYDARARQPHRSAEYRLVYPAGVAVMREAREGDLCWVGRVGDTDELAVIIATPESNAAAQIDRLFGSRLLIGGGHGSRLEFLPLEFVDDVGLDIEDADMLAILGVDAAPSDPGLVHAAIDRFGGEKEMPPTQALCQFVWERRDVGDPATEIDTVLLDWFNSSTEVFLGLEQHLVGPVLDAEFALQEHIDVDRFFAVARRFQNSRFSRAGATWELHLAAAFRASGVQFTHNRRRLADRTKPDFLFPSVGAFEDERIDPRRLTVLGAKTTAKERWLQLLGEGAVPVDLRYLATLDKDLTADVLRTMKVKGVRPVIPAPLVEKHYAGQTWAWPFSAFIEELDRRERLA